MNYQKIYDDLIVRAKTRNKPAGYTERHHVIPKCLGGTNDQENLVHLTPSEHYIAHQLLVKINLKHKGIIHAAWRMAHGNKQYYCGHRVYSWLRIRFYEANRGGKNMSKEGRLRISQSNKTRVISDETRRRYSEAQKKRPPRKPHTDETRKQISDKLKGIPMPDEQRKRISETMKGRKRSPESVAKGAESQRGAKRSPETCLKMSLAKRGTKLSPETRAKMSIAQKLHRQRQRESKS